MKQAEDSFRQQIGLKFEEESSKVLHLLYSFVWFCNLDTSKSRPEYLESFEMWCWRSMAKIIWTNL